MTLIRLPGEALGRHTRVFRARRGLQDVEQVEADRLLDLYGATLCTFFSDVPDADIAAAPIIFHELLLGKEQLLEPLGGHAIHSPLGAAAELFNRGRPRRVLDHEFGEIDRTAGTGVDRKGDLAKILSVGNLVGMRT
jgi:hypothetical protein